MSGVNPADLNNKISSLHYQMLHGDRLKCCSEKPFPCVMAL